MDVVPFTLAPPQLRYVLRCCPCPAKPADTALGIIFPQVHSFFLQELCDVYLEWSKSTLNSDTASAADVQVGAFAPYSFRVDALS